MTLQKREKVLAAVTGGLLLAFAGRFFSFGPRSLAELRTQRDALAADVEEKELRKTHGMKAAEKFAYWRRRSLPSDLQNAESLYRGWLRTVVDPNLDDVTIDPGELGAARNDACRQLSYTVSGKGTLDQLTQMLHQFYSAGHLHQMRTLDITPIKGAPRLQLTIAIAALSLDGAEKDKLSGEPPEKPPAELAVYRKAIVERNPFAPFQPPEKEKKKPSPPKPDDAKNMFVTAVATDPQGKAQVWIVDRNKNETLTFHEGDAIEHGSVKGKVTRIGSRDVEIDIDGTRHRVAVGGNLAEAIQSGTGD